MAIKNRNKAIELLGSRSSPQEMANIKSKEDARKRVAAIVDAVKPLQKEIEKAKDDPDKQYKIMERMSKIMSAGFTDLTQAINTKLDEVKAAGYTGSKGQGDFALTMQNMAASLAKGLDSVRDSVDKKPVPVWRFPQYLFSGLRNTQFEPVNPAIAPFGIDKYDDIKLTSYDVNGNPGVVTYYKNSVVTAVLTLTYDGSGNLTDAHRTT
jgi:hypothetical protein